MTLVRRSSTCSHIQSIHRWVARQCTVLLALVSFATFSAAAKLWNGKWRHKTPLAFKVSFGFSLEELQRQHQLQQVQEQCILLLGVEAPKNSSPTRFARYSQFSAICRQRHKTEWFDLSPEKSFFREQFWHWNLVVQYAGLPFPVNRNMTERGLMASINIPAGFSNFFTGIRCLKKLL